MSIFGDELKGVPIHWRMGIYIGTGVLGGLTLGILFSLWVLFIWWIDGMPSYIPSSMSPWDIVKTYLLSGISAGVIGGIGAPMARGYVSTGFLGILCAIPFYVILAHNMNQAWYTDIELAIIVGGLGGIGFYHMWLKD